MVQWDTFLAGPVMQKWGKSGVFLVTSHFSGQTKVARRCDGLTDGVKLLQRYGVPENGLRRWWLGVGNGSAIESCRGGGRYLGPVLT